RERSEAGESAGHVKGRGKQAGLHFTAAPLRVDENEAIEEFDLVSGADAAVEILEIGATAQGDVLTVVDVLAARQNIRSGAAAEERALLEKAYAPARLTQRAAGRQPRQPAADHDHVFQECSLPSGARNALLR